MPKFSDSSYKILKDYFDVIKAERTDDDDSYILGQKRTIVSEGGIYTKLYQENEAGDFIGHRFIIQSITGNNFRFEYVGLESTHSGTTELAVGERMWFRKDSFFHDWLLNNPNASVDFEDFINTNKSFIYFGDILQISNSTDYNIEFNGLKDWTMAALPEHNRTDNLTDFMEVYWDRVYHQIYNLTKTLWAMIDPKEVKIDHLDYLATRMNIDTDKDKVGGLILREWVDQLIYWLKRKGGYTSWIAVYKMILGGTRNKLNIFEKWCEWCLFELRRSENWLIDRDFDEHHVLEYYSGLPSGGAGPEYYSKYQIADYPVHADTAPSGCLATRYICGDLNDLDVWATTVDDIGNIATVTDYSVLIDNYDASNVGNVAVYGPATVSGAGSQEVRNCFRVWMDGTAKPSGGIMVWTASDTEAEELSSGERGTNKDWVGLSYELLGRLDAGTIPVFKLIQQVPSASFISTSTFEYLTDETYYIVVEKKNDILTANFYDNPSHKSTEILEQLSLNLKGGAVGKDSWNTAYTVANRRSASVMPSSSFYGEVSFLRQSAGEVQTLGTTGTKVITPHIRVELDLSTEPMGANYIISQDQAEELVRYWEYLKPVSKFVDYNWLLSPVGKIDDNSEAIKLYNVDNTAFCDTQFVGQPFVSASTPSSGAELGPDGDWYEETYKEVRLISADEWSIFHGLGSSELIIQTYDKDDFQIWPINHTFPDDNRVVINWAGNKRGKTMAAAALKSWNHSHLQSEPASAWNITHNQGVSGANGVAFEIISVSGSQSVDIGNMTVQDTHFDIGPLESWTRYFGPSAWSVSGGWVYDSDKDIYEIQTVSNERDYAVLEPSGSGWEADFRRERIRLTFTTSAGGPPSASWTLFGGIESGTGGYSDNFAEDSYFRKLTGENQNYFNAPYAGTWTGSSWVSDVSHDDAGYVMLEPSGSWIEGYRPSKAKITFAPGGDQTLVGFVDADGSLIASDSFTLGQQEVEIDLRPTGIDDWETYDLGIVYTQAASGNEDLTTFTEYDTDGALSVTSSRSTFTGLRRDSDSRLFKDYGSQFFGDFTIDFYWELAVNNVSAQTLLVGLSNIPNATKQDMLDSSSGLIVTVADSGNDNWATLRDIATGESDSDALGQELFRMYVTLIRTGTTVTCDFWQGANQTGNHYGSVLIDPSYSNFRYLYITTGIESETLPDRIQTGYVQNLSIDYSGGHDITNIEFYDETNHKNRDYQKVTTTDTGNNPSITINGTEYFLSDDTAAAGDIAHYTMSKTGPWVEDVTIGGGSLDTFGLQDYFKSTAVSGSIALRFENINIAQGTTINSATMNLYADYQSDDGGIQSGPATVHVYGLDEDTGDIPADLEEWETDVASNLTAATLDWEFQSDTGFDSTGYGTSPDLSSIIQEIIDRPGWSANNELVLYCLFKTITEFETEEGFADTPMTEWNILAQSSAPAESGVVVFTSDFTDWWYDSPGDISNLQFKLLPASLNTSGSSGATYYFNASGEAKSFGIIQKNGYFDNILDSNNFIDTANGIDDDSDTFTYIPGPTEKVLTIDTNDLLDEDRSTDLTDFPLMISLSNSCGKDNVNMSEVFASIGDDYQKLYVKDTDGTNLWVEVENWNGSVASPSGAVWVRVPSIPMGDIKQLTLEYDSDAANNPKIGLTGSVEASNVWDRNYAHVYHMNRTPITGEPNVWNSQIASGGNLFAVNLVEDKLHDTRNFGDFRTPSGAGKSIRFPGNNNGRLETVSGAYDMTNDNAFTMEAHYRPDVWPAGSQNDYLIHFNHTDEVNWGASLYIEDSNNAARSNVSVGAGSDTIIVGTTSQLQKPEGKWAYVGAKWSNDGNQYMKLGHTWWNPDHFRLISGGQPYGTGNAGIGVEGVFHRGGGALRIGDSSGTAGRQFPGLIGEVRYSRIERSNTYLKATQKTLFDNLNSFAVTATDSGSIDYYFTNDYASVNWTNTGNAVDGNTGTAATAPQSTISSLGVRDGLSTFSTSGNKTIDTVSFRVWGDNVLGAGCDTYPIFPGGNGDAENIDGLGDEWSGWFDITDDSNAPGAGNWTWEDFQRLKIWLLTDAQGGGETYDVMKVEAKADYTSQLGDFGFESVSGSYVTDSNTLVTTLSGGIDSVEIRVKKEGSTTSELRPVYNDTQFGDSIDITAVDGWSAWFDITTDSEAPGPWLWSDIYSLGSAVHTNDVETGDFKLYDTEIRVNEDATSFLTDGNTSTFTSAGLDNATIIVSGATVSAGEFPIEVNKVWTRAYGKIDGYGGTFDIIPVFDGVSGTAIDITSQLSSVEEYTPWIRIDNDLNAPAVWTENDIDTLGIRLDYNSYSSLDDLAISQVDVKVEDIYTDRDPTTQDYQLRNIEFWDNTVSAGRVTFDTMPRKAESYVSLGQRGLQPNFEFWFDYEITSAGKGDLEEAKGGEVALFTVSNIEIDDIRDLSRLPSGGYAISMRAASLSGGMYMLLSDFSPSAENTIKWNIGESAYGTSTSTDQLYVKFNRYTSYGESSQPAIVARYYLNDNRLDLLYTQVHYLSWDGSLLVNDYTYILNAAGEIPSGGGAGSQSWTMEYGDGTWTVAGAQSAKMTIAASPQSKINFTEYKETDSAYAYKDFGNDFFEDIEVEWIWKLEKSILGAESLITCFANEIGDGSDLVYNSADGIFLMMMEESNRFRVWIYNDGSVDAELNLSNGSPYEPDHGPVYFKMKRTAGDIKVYAYRDPRDGTNPWETKQWYNTDPTSGGILGGSTTGYRYFYPHMSKDSAGSANTASSWVSGATFYQPVSGAPDEFYLTENDNITGYIHNPSQSYDNPPLLVLPARAQQVTPNDLKLTFAEPIDGRCFIRDDDYFHTQSTASTSWVINHNLNSFGQIVHCYDHDNNWVFPDEIQLASRNVTVATFAEPVSGTAVLITYASDIYRNGTTQLFGDPNLGIRGYWKIGEGGDNPYFDPKKNNDINTILTSGGLSSFTQTTTAASGKLLINFEVPKDTAYTINELGVFDSNSDLHYYTRCSTLHKPDDVELHVKYRIDIE